MPCRGALHGGAPCYGVPCCFVFCRVSLCRDVLWVHRTSVPAWGGVGACSTGLLCCVERGLRFCGWLVVRGLWLGVVPLVGSVLRGSGCFLLPVGQAGVCGVALPRGPCLGPVSSGGCLPLGVCRVVWGRVSSSSLVCWVPSSPVPPPPFRSPSLMSQPCPLFLRLCCCVCVVALALSGVAAWRLGCGVGLCGVLGGSLCGWFPFFLVYPPSPVRGLVVCGRDPVRFVRRQVRAAAARLGGRAPGGRSAWCLGVAVALCCRAKSAEWGAGAVLVFPVWRAPPSWCASWCPLLRPLPQCHGPFPRVGGPPAVPCRRVALPPLPCPCGRLPATCNLSSPPCCGPSLCHFPPRCAGGGVVVRPVGR